MSASTALSTTNLDPSRDWLSTRGVVLTPPFLVDLMVQEAVRAQLDGRLPTPESLRTTRWLDPAAGDGAFVLGIIRYYIKVLGRDGAVKNFPNITAIDVSQVALDKAKRNVAAFLENEFRLPSGLCDSIRFVTANTVEEFTDNPPLFHASPTYDVVIGNPPYIRYTHLSSEDRALAKTSFPGLFGGSADFFTYFFGAALNAASDGGVVTFVTPASFVRNAAGLRVRKRIVNRAAVLSFLDLDELRIFEHVGVHAAVTTLGIGRLQGAVRFKRYASVTEVESDSKTAINPSLRRFEVTATGGWNFARSQSSSVTVTSFPTMEESGVQVRSGVRSGAASVFLIPDVQAKAFSDVIRSRWLRPVVLATDIRKWSVDPSKWIIWTNREAGVPPKEILDYLELHRSRLEARPEVQNGATPWFSLRPCAYGDLLLRECIVSPDITVKPRFAVKSGGTVVSDGAFAIGSVDPALLAILNSSWAHEFFKSNASSVGSLESRGRMRIKANVLRQFPVPFGVANKAQLLDQLRSVWVGGQGGSQLPIGDLDSLVNEIYGVAS